MAGSGVFAMPTKKPSPSALTPRTRRTTTNGGTRARKAPLSRADRVARLAYELYEARGGSHGSDVEDWLKAEALVDAEPRASRRRVAR
jgi:hypothetical protein